MGSLDSDNDVISNDEMCIAFFDTPVLGERDVRSGPVAENLRAQSLEVDSFDTLQVAKQCMLRDNGLCDGRSLQLGDSSLECLACVLREMVLSLDSRKFLLQGGGNGALTFKLDLQAFELLGIGYVGHDMLTVLNR